MAEIKVVHQDIFQGVSPGDVFVHGCNSHGVMGSGIAPLVKNRWPLAYRAYRERYEKVGLKVGEVVYAQIIDQGILVANAITQGDFGRDGQRYASYDGIDQCFNQIFFTARKNNWKRVIFPMIGAGLGGGCWNVIAELIKDRAWFQGYDGEIVLYIKD
jgi:O-acetyl-ADP-ribose deacetylase (regulator of RNase III)